MITARENRLDVTWTKPLSLHLYTLATFTAAPLAPGWLAARARRGKEETSRLGEKLGRASRPRPDGALFWMHGASVGEGLSLLPLVADVMIQRPEATVLVTTGTRASGSSGAT